MAVTKDANSRYPKCNLCSSKMTSIIRSRRGSAYKLNRGTKCYCGTWSKRPAPGRKLSPKETKGDVFGRKLNFRIADKVKSYTHRKCQQVRSKK